MTKTFDVKSFALGRDNILIAPAGFGKTHTISECLTHTEGKQLILTHTQAGVASIKEKLQKCNIDKEKYSVETISGFAQRYVLAFHNQDSIPHITSKKYYPFLISESIKLFSLKSIQDIVRFSYSGLFIDEYQDCSSEQHKLILILASVLPAHILGDPMQGIFNFNGKLVNLDDPIEMDRFTTRDKLETPHRWINGGNPKLGEEILQIRDKLELKQEVDFTKYTSIEFKLGDYIGNKSFILNVLTTEKSVLVIHPTSTSVYPRQTFVKSFSCVPLLIESLDEKKLYEWADHFDSTTLTPNEVIDVFITSEFTNIDNWYNKKTKSFKRKGLASEEEKLTDIKRLSKEISSEKSLIKTKEILEKVKNLDKVNCPRLDLVRSLLVAIEDAHHSNITVLEGMEKHRNNIRRAGRKIYGRCIGTTLLTKGLEFDTVIVLDAQNFTPKNLYVALSRSVKRLIVLSTAQKVRSAS